MADYHRRNHWPVHTVVLGCFVLLFGFLTITSSSYNSPTYDESVHLFAGYSYLKWADFRANSEHPPLAKVLAALPLLALDIKDSRPSSPYWDLIPKERDYSWMAANQMLFSDNDAEKLFFYAKLPMIALGMILGVFVYLWAKELFAIPAAVAALFIYGLDPNILAHSPIVHTDIPFTAFLFIGTYFFWRGWNQWTWSNFLLTSLCFGLATITKQTFLAIIPIWCLLGLGKIFSSGPVAFHLGEPRVVSSRRGKTALFMGLFASCLITAYLFIWAAYGFRFHAAPQEAGRLFAASEEISGRPILQALESSAYSYRLFPEAWTHGFIYHMQALRRPAYLLGEISDNGFWSYFPVAFAVKTPLPILLLLLGAAGLGIFERRALGHRMFLFLPVVVYFLLAVWSRMNIGLRHLLPIYPFLFVILGGVAAEIWRGGTGIKRGLLILLGSWYLWSSVHIYPHYLAFFNELVGGAKNGYKVLTDSSLDWGQDLKGLKRWMDRNGVKRIQLAYFGTADPKYYGIDALYLPGSIIFSPRPQSEDPDVPNYLAVSVTYIYGVPSGKPLKDFYKPLKSRKPVATIGHSILVYRLNSG
ncbi:MAG: glycosyltransferase family 39 protein [Deltaproteobacteria bacterium]|nr:glycosyltransferase family 39 protein [Deltaproteobacteria bacterium]